MEMRKRGIYYRLVISRTTDMIYCGIKCGEVAAVISHHRSGVKMKSQTAGEFPPTRSS